MFQTDDKNTFYELIHMSGVFSKFMISYVDRVNNGESMVNERYCGYFLNILKKYKILSTVKTNKISCSLYNNVFYKAAPGCMFNQPDMDCETDMRVKF